MDALGVEAARRRFRCTGDDLGGLAAHVRPDVFASWERSATAGVDLRRVAARFVGHGAHPSAVAEADLEFAAFAALNPDARCSLALVGADDVVRLRHDGDPVLAGLLDAVLFTPGYCVGEDHVGTTAVALVARTGRPSRVDGPEHYHPELTGLSGCAAAVVRDDGGPPDAVVVLAHASAAESLGLPLARMLAERVAERVRSRRHRRARLVHERFSTLCDDGAEWVVATDGAFVLTSPGVRRLPTPDQQSLTDLALASVVLSERRDAERHVDLPSGRCADVAVSPIVLDDEAVGCLVSATAAAERRVSVVPEAVRRQGSHVAPTARRDYAADLRSSGGTDRAHAEARMRANRELLSPYLRARHEVAAGVGQRRHQLLIGETGVGKRTLAAEQFRRAFPTGVVRDVDCSAIGDSAGAPDPLATVAREPEDRPRLLVLRQMNLLSPVAARRLDESLRTLVAMPNGLMVVGCVDSASVDATRPYGLLLRHFHETVRVPALRYRADELGDIAMRILHGLSGGRSLRLSLQVIRVLEGYAWPGNVRELEDVLRYVVARKPVGEIQAPDLPSSCFASRAPRMSMLETAQCDAIIQALYESRGNRYKAAAMLGIARSSLYRKIDAFGISYIG
ncbi:helix-turn-helix domain-containing protein [Pseudonocardia endophytica]|uniref:Transcriptional regulator of acetoin/glycerol metabolism n=1 Tax=Pseudonocardia endophytica TaxID=401976 RepID=A0A4R1HTB0_PSEEN|nr:helix-turn-helix domain-containing protein [Pseudonocardia endophytica]TCK24543.1 transcriptional regulator of acetoin/glycerol metabolism [Pseudonocardia endophytica]